MKISIFDTQLFFFTATRDAQKYAPFMLKPAWKPFEKCDVGNPLGVAPLETAHHSF